MPWRLWNDLLEKIRQASFAASLKSLLFMHHSGIAFSSVQISDTQNILLYSQNNKTQ